MDNMDQNSSKRSSAGLLESSIQLESSSCPPGPPPPSPMLGSEPGDVQCQKNLDPPSECEQIRSLSLTESEGSTLSRQLQCIAEESEKQNDQAKLEAISNAKPMTAAQQRRAHMVKKAIKYFEDKSNRSVSEDNLYTRRKNLAVHLGLDEKVSKKEIQKINTYCLPVPSSVASFDIPDVPTQSVVIVEEEEEEDVRSKNLVHFLGMKDGLSSSIASQGSLSESPRNSTVITTTAVTAASTHSAQTVSSAVVHVTPPARISPTSLGSGNKTSIQMRKYRIKKAF